MSEFAVTVETIGSIREHQNADRLEMATLASKDYDFVVVKGQFQTGDTVIYFPVDSVLPEWVTDALGLTGKLAGKERNRVKTIKLRGNISQGIVANLDVFADHKPAIMQAQVGDNVMALLEVEKFDPPVVPTMYGDLLPLPPFVSKYDIEGAQNHTEVVQRLLNEKVYITEKVEGSHWSVTWFAEDDSVVVSQRNFRIEPVERGEHDWHKLSRLGNYGDKLRAIAIDWEAQIGTKPQAVTIRGEAVGPGIQNNYYKLKQHAVCIFELEVDSKPVEAAQFLALAKTHALPLVPVLAQDVVFRDWLGEKTLKQASDGQSQLAPKLREGIVIKPMIEQRDEKLGRVMLKQRSPEYLAKSDY